MATSLTSKRSDTGAGNGAGGWRNGGGSGAGGFVSLETYRLGMWFAVAGIAMLFIALTSAYVVRQGLGPDWRAIPMPRVLWLSTTLLAASSFTIEKARRAAHPEAGRDSVRRWLSATLVLGLSFLGGQLFAWRRMVEQGIYLATNAHSSFFFVLTGLHGMHVAGGLLALSYALLALRGRALRVEVIAIYWHFMGGLWIYLLIMLFGSR